MDEAETDKRVPKAENEENIFILKAMHMLILKELI